MRFLDHEQDVRARLGRAARRPAGSRSDGRLFDRCCEVLEAARQLEGLVGGRRVEEVDPAVLGCLGAAFESLANTTLILRERLERQPSEAQAATEDRIVELDRLLFAVNQNLDFAAQAADLGREILAGAGSGADV